MKIPRFLDEADVRSRVTFRGGARDDETIAPDGQENIPHLLNDLMPRATFFSQVVKSRNSVALRGDGEFGDGSP